MITGADIHSEGRAKAIMGRDPEFAGPSSPKMPKLTT